MYINISLLIWTSVCVACCVTEGFPVVEEVRPPANLMMIPLCFTDAAHYLIAFPPSPQSCKIAKKKYCIGNLLFKIHHFLSTIYCLWFAKCSVAAGLWEAPASGAWEWAVVPQLPVGNGKNEITDLLCFVISIFYFCSVFVFLTTVQMTLCSVIEPKHKM